MQVRAVQTRADRGRFLDLPHAVHADHPLWVPELRRDIALAMNRRRHPFYRHSDAAFLVAVDGDRTLGRLSVMEHRPSNEFHGRHEAFFHHFESVDDEAVAQALFAAAGEWAVERGLDSLVGPKGMLPSDGHGILVDGFEYPPVVGVAWHPPCYDRLVKAAGLEKATDYLSGAMDLDADVPAQAFEAADHVAVTGGYEVKRFSSRREVRRWAGRLGALYNDTFEENFEYSPMNTAEMKVVADQFLPIVDPARIMLLMHGDEVAGYLIMLPDVSDALRSMRGRVTPAGLWRLMRAVKRTPRVVMLAFGITPAHRGRGVNLLMYATLARSRGHHYEHAEVVQVEEGNYRMMRNMEAIQVEWTKRHRMYEMGL
jgi:hypothetical protein